MNIEINQTVEILNRKNEIYWRFKWKKFLSNIRILSFCTLVMIIICTLYFINSTEFQNSSDFDRNSIYVCSILSILLIVFITSQLLKYKKLKKIHFENVVLLGESKVTINDEVLSFKTKATENNIKWNAIKSFLIVENCLFLSQFPDNENFEFIIDLNSIPTDEKNLLLKFLK